MNKPILTEEDIRALFGDDKSEKKPITASIAEDFVVGFEPEHKPTPKSEISPIKPPPINIGDMPKSGIFRQIIKIVGTFILLFIIFFSIVNGPALIAKMRYFWQVEYKQQNWGNNFTLSQNVDASVNKLIIPEIGVDAPISWDVTDDDIVSKLEGGVAHYAGTALPGQVGNVFITGHSSYYIWAPGSYKQVFALLDKLNAGDKIYVVYQGKTYTYEVTNRVVVNPEEMQVLNQSKENTLSLMTCTPVGTNLKRLIVSAKQINVNN